MLFAWTEVSSLVNAHGSRLAWPKLGEVHLHATNLDVEGPLLRSASVLSTDELHRTERFRFDRDKRRFIAGRSFLRGILGRYVGERPDQVQFSYTEAGKPDLAGPAQSLRFNFSHSGPWAILGVAVSEIGVDIEEIRSVPELEDIARDCLSPRETETVLAAEGAERVSRFFACWTRKEALVKAIGLGIAAPMQRFETERWTILAPSLGDDLIVAVAVRHEDAWIGRAEA